MKRRRPGSLAALLVAVALVFLDKECVADDPESAVRVLASSSTEQGADTAVRWVEGARLEMVQQLGALLRGSSSDAVKARACYLMGEYGEAALADPLVDNITILYARGGEGAKIPLFGAFPCAEALAKFGHAIDDRILRMIVGTDSACKQVLGAVVLGWAARRADPKPAPWAEEVEAGATLRAAMVGRKGAELARLQAALGNLEQGKLNWSAPCVPPSKPDGGHKEQP